MGTQEPGQEWLDAYRYQLAVMSYGAATAHYHRLPSLRSAFRQLFLNLIHKMLLRDVWGYWFLTSHSGVFVDPDIKELRKPWADPVVKENIMYFGHLLLMVSLYAMLFDDDKFNKENALEFRWDPSLQNSILKEMEREKWLGVCCEPNSIFINCNQFPLIALRCNDLRDKTTLAEEVQEKYIAAWKYKGMVQEDGRLIMWYFPKQDSKTLARDIGSTAWSSAYMNAWNPSAGRESWKKAVGFLAKPNDSEVVVSDPRVALQIRELVASERLDSMDPQTYRKAEDMVAAKEWPQEPGIPFTAPTFGYAIQWASEVGDEDTLKGMLTHADKALNPTWERGGFFHKPAETETNRLEPSVDAFTGNAAVGYGRLNVFDGQRKMYEKPWTTEHFASTPFIEGIDFSSNVDFLRAEWNEELHALVATVRTWNDQTKPIQVTVSCLPEGRYGVYKNGHLDGVHVVTGQPGSLKLDVVVSGQELDVVILRKK